MTAQDVCKALKIERHTLRYEALRVYSLGVRFLFLDLGERSCVSVDNRSTHRPSITLDLEPVYRRVSIALSAPTAFTELPFPSYALPLSGASA